MFWAIPLFFVVSFEIVADILAKEWSLKTNLFWLAIAALISYLIANSFWLIALKNGSGLARGAVIFSVATAVSATLLGLFWYQEKLSTVQIIGLLVGLVSIVLIFWK